MPLVRYRLRPLAAFRTLPSASMLWGHLAWAVRALEGEQALLDWIEAQRVAIEDGKSPPLRLSSAFPGGYLPRPLLGTVDVEETVLRKALKAVRWVSPSLFEAMLARGETALVEALQSDSLSQNALTEEPFLRLPRTRVAMDRRTGTAAEGQLFQDAVYWIKKPLDVYAEAAGEREVDRLYRLLSFVGEMGFGGGASVGLGAFAVDPPEPSSLPSRAGGARVLLGPALLPEGARGYWRARLYWGRLGQTFAQAPVPFKRPYLRAEEGSVLVTDNPLLLDVTPSEPPVPGARIYEYLAPLAIAVPEGVVA